MKIYLNYNDARWEKYKIDFGGIVNIAEMFAVTENKTEGVINKTEGRLFLWMRSALLLSAFDKINREVSIILTNDDEIQKMNKKYRKINKPTNVLSFETGDDELLGDIFISFDTVMRESIAENKKFKDHAAHMVVHGVLHLMGYDHINDDDARKMEKMEIEILKKLKIKNPY